MKLLVLKKDNETWEQMKEKTREEIEEVFEVIDLLKFEKDEIKIKKLKHDLAGELLDVMQMCLGGLDKLEDENIRNKNTFKKHSEKLIKRGWGIKHYYQLTKKPWHK